MTKEEMVNKFQCRGCVCGSDTKCGQYSLKEDMSQCTSHVVGTIIAGVGNFALGLPKGFCRTGYELMSERTSNKLGIRLWSEGESPNWDNFNIAVWAMEKDGYLFVRTFAPRVDITWIDVIEKGTLAMVPNALDVSAFIDEMN